MGAFVRDITTQKVAKDTLQKQKEFLDVIYNDSDIAFLFIIIPIFIRHSFLHKVLI